MRGRHSGDVEGGADGSQRSFDVATQGSNTYGGWQGVAQRGCRPHDGVGGGPKGQGKQKITVVSTLHFVLSIHNHIALLPSCMGVCEARLLGRMA